VKRRAARTDGNQTLIIDAFRAGGATVAPTHAAGEGFPDLVVGYMGENRLVEVKNGNNPPSKRKLTPDQVGFHSTWRGSIDIIEQPEQVWHLLAAIRFATIQRKAVEMRGKSE
jgi:hypothetical protein